MKNEDKKKEQKEFLIFCSKVQVLSFERDPIAELSKVLNNFAIHEFYLILMHFFVKEFHKFGNPALLI